MKVEEMSSSSEDITSIFPPAPTYQNLLMQDHVQPEARRAGQDAIPAAAAGKGWQLPAPLFRDADGAARNGVPSQAPAVLQDIVTRP
jgi:hypothetical protein